MDPTSGNYQLDLPNAEGYGISARDVSTFEPMSAILLENVSGI